MFCSLAAQATNSTEAATPAAYLPLAVGNSWTWSCSTEGVAQFRKTQRIVAVTSSPTGPVFRAELRTGADAKPLVTYFALAADGHVIASLQADLSSATPVIGADPKPGQRFGELSVAGSLRYDRRPFRGTAAVRLQNFDQESPTLSEEQRLKWKSRVYGKSIGLLEEADGLGGACLLSQYKVKRR